jgi:hypothetical protein
VADSGELAARLNPVNTFDRRGNVIWWTSFEDGTGQVSLDYVGTGGRGTLSTLEAKSGMWSVKCVGGSDSLLYSRVVKALAYPALGKIGFEAGLIEYTTVGYIEWRITHWDGAAGERYTIRWYPSTSSLYYVNAASAAVLISNTIGAVPSVSLWNICKLVVDIQAGEYVRVLFDDQEWSLVGIAGEPFASAWNRFIQVDAGVFSRNGQNDYLWVDDFIVTQNEP